MKYDPSAILDPDYGILCGTPRVRTIYHTQLRRHIEVYAIDIGRAPQPKPNGTPAAAIEAEPGDETMFERRGIMPKKLREKERLDEFLRQHQPVSSAEIQKALGMARSSLRDLINRFPGSYDCRVIEDSNGKGNGNLKQRRMFVSIAA